MSGALQVVEPGLHTTVQDRGRFGFQYAGVPVSGALDADSLAIANALVGNAPSAAALEMRYTGPTLVVDAEGVVVALTGTGGTLEILGHGETRSVPAYRSVHAGRGARLRVRPAGDSATAYLAVAGGIDVPEVLGSRSTYVRGGFGGFRGRMLEAGDALEVRAVRDGERPELVLPTPPDLHLPAHIRAVAGPQAERFTAEALDLFTASAWRIGDRADRMGIRLDGPVLAHSRGHDIVSDGIVTGSVQVPGSGQPIVLLADRQTTGGYPKIATVISADLPALGRARVGATLRFDLIDAARASAARRQHTAAMRALLAAIVLADEGTASTEKLLSENLISGVFGDV